MRNKKTMPSKHLKHRSKLIKRRKQRRSSHVPRESPLPALFSFLRKPDGDDFDMYTGSTYVPLRLLLCSIMSKYIIKTF
jgi:hypothetical protein